jgi:hypothetical protein
MRFIDKLQAAQQHNRSSICLALNVRIDKLPMPMARIDDPMFPFARSIIDATQDLVCAYSIDLAYYLSEAAPGMIALERITRYIPDNVPIIFDAKFGKLGDSANRSARGAFEAFQADAATFGSMPSQSTIEAFLKFEGKMIFLPGDNLDEAISQARICNVKLNGGCGIRVEVDQLDDLPEIEVDIPIIVSAHEALSPQAAQKVKNFIKSHSLSIVDVGSSVLYESRREDYMEVVRSTVSTNRFAQQINE